MKVATDAASQCQTPINRCGSICITRPIFWLFIFMIYRQNRNLRVYGQIAWYWEWKELFEVTEVKLKDLGVKITKGM
jgi:hypothetical protein